MEKRKIRFYSPIAIVSEQYAKDIKEIPEQALNKMDNNLSKRMDVSRENYFERELQSKIESAKVIVNT